MKLEIKKFEELSGKEIYEILKVRAEVFVVEQDCPYNDPDGKDIDSIHIMLKKEGAIIAYLRVLKSGVSYNTPSLGRVLVVKEGRGKGLARELVLSGIDYIINTLGEETITIGAQEYLKSFYESLGFVSISEIYLEDNIPHLDMIYEKNN